MRCSPHAVGHLPPLAWWLAGFVVFAVAAQATLEQTGDGGRVQVRSVQVDPAEPAVIATGWVNQVSGPIELLACGPGGKTHESVFVLNLDPVDLQAALLLIGLEPGEPLPKLGHGPPKGPGVDIWVEWKAASTTNMERAERFAYNVETEAALPETEWIFTGSTFENGQFKASAEESLVATFWDPWAIMNIPLPCGSNDEILLVNDAIVPPLKTPVTFRFVPKDL